ncbi:MAG: PLP-dependent transferase, partial [Pseudomonadota bacterium]
MSDTSRAAQGQRTIAAQAAGAFDAETGGVVPAIHMATTFGRDADYAPLNPDNIYQRCDSENVRAAENLLAALEGAGACALFPSGMAAVAAVLNTLPAGASVLVQKQIYYGTTALTRTFCERRGLALHEVDTSDTQAVAAAVQAHQPALIWVETPSNPWLRITDIAAVAKLARPAGALLAVDSTAATPVMSQPLQ